MAGHVNISLYNITQDKPHDPVLIYLPPVGDTEPPHFSVPKYLHDVPLAVIHYRWSGKTRYFGAVNSAMHWPTPIFDVSFAWAWLAENLRPAGEYARRDFYVFGAQLGAPLAVTLALTNCWPHAAVAIRGVATCDGVYDWTRFLPDHWDNRPKPNKPATGHTRRDKDRQTDTLPPPLDAFKRRIPALFNTPENLFDSSASPFLLFATSGLKVPQTFHKTIREEYQDRHLPIIAQSEDEAIERLRKEATEYYQAHGYIDISHDEQRYDLDPDPEDISHFMRRLAVRSHASPPVHLNFPSWDSLLAIPETLLMYTASATERASPSGLPDNTVHGVQLDVSQSRVPLTPYDVDPCDEVYGPEADPGPLSWRARQPLALRHTCKTQAIVLGNELVRSVQRFEAEPRSRHNDPDFGAYMRRLKTRIMAADVGDYGGLDLTDRAVKILLGWLQPRMQRSRDYAGLPDAQALELQEAQEALEKVAGRDYWNIHSEYDIGDGGQADQENLVEEEHPGNLDEYPGEVEYDQLDDPNPIMSEKEEKSEQQKRRTRRRSIDSI